MRDEHRPKQDLIHEVTGLRKQVLDLKDAMTARRRVEEALRAAETLLRSLTDGASVGLCLFRRDGTPVIANRPFARMLGYDSPAELVRIGSVLGIFATPEERNRVLGSDRLDNGQSPDGRFRLKDGSQEYLRVIASGPDQDCISVVVFDRLPDPPASEVETLATHTDQA
jgi:PAS domain-containing protein